MSEMNPAHDFEQHWADYDPGSAEVLKNWSPALIAMQEYSLLHWAKANQIEEAYRLTQTDKILDDPIIRVMRVWSIGSSINLFQKHNLKETVSGRKFLALNSSIAAERYSTLKPTSWSRFQRYMAAQFWEDSAWQDKRVILTSSTFLLEGYRKGKYRLYETDGAAARKGIMIGIRLMNKLV